MTSDPATIGYLVSCALAGRRLDRFAGCEFNDGECGCQRRCLVFEGRAYLTQSALRRREGVA